MTLASPTLGMGILSWRGAESLDYALETYRAAGLFDLFDARVIILPEPNDAVKTVAAKHPLTAHEFKRNLGIAGGMRAVAEALTTDYVLFLENDCPLIESFETAQFQINQAISAMEAREAIMTRLRSRHTPGELFTTLPKYNRYWGRGPLAKLRRNLRPQKAKRLCGTAVYARPNPHEAHPKYIREYAPESYLVSAPESYLVSAKVMPWTNQSILLRRMDFLEIILPYVESQPLGRAINGFHNIEIELNKSEFWTHSNYNIFCPAGLFSHMRLGDRGYV